MAKLDLAGYWILIRPPSAVVVHLKIGRFLLLALSLSKGLLAVDPPFAPTGARALWFVADPALTGRGYNSTRPDGPDTYKQVRRPANSQLPRLFYVAA